MRTSTCILSATSDNKLSNLGNNINTLTSPKRKATATLTKDDNLVIFTNGIKTFDLAQTLAKTHLLDYQERGEAYIKISNTDLIWAKPSRTGKDYIYTKIDFTNTDPNENKKLCITDDGNLIIYATTSGKPIWSAKPLPQEPTTTLTNSWLYLAIGAAILFGFIKNGNKK
jgi:hypothetical protein